MSLKLALGCCCNESPVYYYSNPVVLGPQTCQSLVICRTGADGGNSTFPWANPGNITAADGNTADCTLGTSTGTFTSNNLIATNFGFTIPSNAQNIVIANVRVGTVTGTTSRAVTTKAYATLDGSATTGTAGTSSQVWNGISFGISGVAAGLVLTPSQVNASTFGVILQCSVTNPITFDGKIIAIDAVKMTVCYQLPL